MNERLLDNPIWSSLSTEHAGVATGGALARRYRSTIGPLSGMAEPSAAAWEELAGLIPADDVGVLFLTQRTRPPAGWRIVLDGTLAQMICRGEPAAGDCAGSPVIRLGAEDVPEMIALAALAAPGPFRQQTAELGGFLGIRIDGRLVAMAGQRMRPTKFTEVSAVSTHPEFRGRGYAQALVAAVASDIRSEGRTPFLTVMGSNARAIGVYRRAGFELRRTLELAVVAPPAPFGTRPPSFDMPHTH